MEAIVPETAHVVYWIIKPEHTDMICEGYIGVTNRFDRRLWEHKTLTQNRYLANVIAKYGWDYLVKEKLVISTEEYCLELERKLRPSESIGWNLVAGGGKPPSSLGKKFIRTKPSYNKGLTLADEVKEKISIKVKSLWEDPVYRERMCNTHKGRQSNMKGKKQSPESIEKMRQSKLGKSHSEETKLKMSLAQKGRKYEMLTCPHCGKIGGSTGIKSWHFDNCRNKGINS